MRKLDAIPDADQRELKSIEDALLSQVGTRSKSADPARIPRFMREWQVRPSTKRDDRNEEVPAPPKNRGRVPNFMKEWQSKTNAEPESIPKVQPRAKFRAKSEDKEEVPVKQNTTKNNAR